MEISWAGITVGLYIGRTKMMGLNLNYNLTNNSASRKVVLSIGLVFIALCSLYSQNDKARWVDSVFSSLSREEKIAQLFFISVHPEDDEDKRERDRQWIKNLGAGGVLVSGGGPEGVRKWINHLQQEAKVPLLAGLNAEEGLGLSLDSCMEFPPILSLGAIQQDSLLFFMGTTIAQQLRTLGIHFNLAPSVNPSSVFQTPDLYYHAWSNNPQHIAAKSTLYASGLRAEGVLSVIKYYPYFDLQVSQYQKNTPVLTPQKPDAGTQDIFNKLSSWCHGTLLGYEHNPLLVPGKKWMRSDPKRVATTYPLLFSADWLKANTSFKGLTFSYLPDLKGVLKKDRAGDAEWYALMAGNDVMIEPRNLSAVVRRLNKKISKSPQAQARLDDAVRKILAMKYDAGLAQYRPAAKINPHQLISAQSKILKRKLTEQSLVLLHNRNNRLPLTHPDQLKIAVLNIGERQFTTFAERIRDYAPAQCFNLQFPSDTTGLLQSLKKHNLILASIYPYAKPVLDLLPDLLKQLTNEQQLVVCNFSSPEILPSTQQISALIQAWTDSPEAQQAAASAIFGAIPLSGRLPVEAAYYAEGSGLTSSVLDVLQFAEPEEADMSREVLNRIERVAREAIDEKATPGCQVAVVRKGKVVYHRSFGWLTYDNQTPVNNNTLYDLASVTKVAATLQAVMFLYEKGMIDLYKKVSVYLPEMQNTNKKDIILKDVLTHQAGLVPFEPWYPLTMKDTTLLPHYYSRVRTEKFPLQVAPRLFAAPHIRDSVWNWTLKSRMLTKSDRTPYPFRYSDLSFIILHRLAEKLLNQPMEDFLKQNLYDPLGASALGFNPLTWADSSNIAPTEYDKIFRKQWISGTVHDERAAMIGGVSGHAGLFGNAIDLAKIGQMLLQKGSYGGIRFFKPETVELFSTRQFETSRRGLGWDKPMLSDFTSPTSFYASSKTYGHTGFTGTCIWIDPEFELVYIFLSNRTYPDRNNKLITLNIRSRIQDIIYQSIFDYCSSPDPLPWSALK
ncbi:MAG: serine hydrolase [Cyclobacteriaceae bacterium]|nr:serine hydrolase [Cyclobacteriaceae bacterium]